MLNLRLEEWSVDNNMVRKIWFGMSITNIHLLQFKIKGHLQKRGLWMPVHQNSFRRKPSKISNIKFTILSFSHQYTLALLSSWVLWSLLPLINSSDALQKWFILTQGKQNLEFVNLICYLHITTHSSVLKHFVPTRILHTSLLYTKFALFQLRYIYLPGVIHIKLNLLNFKHG